MESRCDTCKYYGTLFHGGTSSDSCFFGLELKTNCSSYAQSRSSIQEEILIRCKKYKGVKVEFGIEKFCIYTNDGGHKFSLTDNVSEIEEWLKTNCELMQDCTPKGKSFFECVCYYCGKGCEAPNPNCGRLSEIKFALQECDRAKFLADNFTYQEFEDAKKIQSEIRCKKVKETICYNCTYNTEKCCDRGIDLRSISDTCRYKQEINILPF